MGKATFTLTIPSIGYKKSLTILIKDENGIIGSNDKAITYTQNENGEITWSENTTEDIKKIGEAMLLTNYGKTQFDKWMNTKTRVYLEVNYKKYRKREGYAKTIAKKIKGKYLNADGQYIKIDVTFYDKVIREEINNTGKRFDGATLGEAYGANGCHEVEHNNPTQIALDDEIEIEEEQDPKLNKPLNAEVNYRREYHSKFPNKGKKDWEKSYKNLGYYGID